MRSRLPAVSIGLPVFNAESTIRVPIESILAQDFEDFELVIVDNASADSTPSICEGYAKADSRVRFHRNTENIGASPNHNRAFDLSRGRYFMWAADDMECLPGMLRACHDVIAPARPGVALVYPRCQMVDALTRLERSEAPSIASSAPRAHVRMATVLRNLVWVNQLYGLMPADVLRQTRLEGSFPSSDYVLLAELAMLGEIIEIPRILLRRTMHAQKGTAARLERPSEWTNWLDPSSRHDRFALSRDARLLVEYVRSSLRVPPSPADRLLCTAAVLYVKGGRMAARPTVFRARRWALRAWRWLSGPGRKRGITS
jgi:glycosyltransferase involved in cell wall biosynthesis